jgi:hypothetical protein
MKKLFITIFVLSFLLLSLGVSAEKQSEELKFKGFEFGTNRSKIKDKENAILIKDEIEEVHYKEVLFNEDFLIIYKFGSTGMKSASYRYNDIPIFPSVYTNTYFKIKESITSKYGEPGFSENTWGENPKFKDNLGKAVIEGELEIRDVWKFKNGTISMVLGKLFDEVIFNVMYYSNDKSVYNGSSEDKF